MYLNPLYPHDFPDPFVFKFCGEYWAVCTGFWHDGGVFGMLHSRDLVNWKDAGSALNPPPFEAPCYWAPEIFYDNGKFYLYYSVGNEENMEIRVAVSDSPAGNYLDSGNRLTSEQFAIDAHVFVDDDNSRWFFYATDFLTHSHIGTGTVRDRMLSPFRLEGNPQPVSRARYDWQVYDPNRASKGNVRWHTIEGSSVLKRKGVYYQMYSGGNWQNISYGVSYATTRNIHTSEEWSQYSDGEKTLPILRTIPGKVIGPGHNSVVRGPDNRQFFCVYHRWAEDLRGRLLAIDRLDFAGERMFILGASTEPQFEPNPPTILDFFDQDRQNGLGENWICNDEQNWFANSQTAISNANAESAEAICKIDASSFLIEISSKTINFTDNNSSAYGFSLKNDFETILSCHILPGTKQIEITFAENTEIYDLHADFEPSAFHLWRIEVDNLSLKIRLDEANFYLERLLDSAPNSFALSTRLASAAFAGFGLTVGFEELFDNQAADLNSRGWQIERGEENAWQIGDGQLNFAGSLPNVLIKNLTLENFESVANILIERGTTPEGICGFYFKQAGSELFLTIETEGGNYYLQAHNQLESRSFALPNVFAPEEFNQFRFRRENDRLLLQLETFSLGEIKISTDALQFGIFGQNAKAAFEMIRVTAL